ncbi:MAG: GNAT family N-acetyltransferase [Anaerolineales bacterium]|nr:GNAT family N-acetyltransferase [Anaerolineales bacterium]
MTIEVHRITAENAERFAGLLAALAGEPPPPEAWALEAAWVLAAELEGQPVGVAVVVPIPKLDARRGFLFVDELSVLPAYRRQGVARALLAHVEQLARDLSLAGVRLLARPENAAARRLYARLGYQLNDSVFCEKRIENGGDGTTTDHPPS